ncbi:hypothetical protein QTO34_006511 [Cnephaeus nilssonii]|uniref:C-type lectin domain family 4 member K n=1 Tax=Cnephaeus nilssonii TaxID=3371016 RepID=A0AA40HKN4_CNENI|nr:hypothetical protein QTO34_006511 [Eptesicus nilssonii]
MRPGLLVKALYTPKAPPLHQGASALLLPPASGSLDSQLRFLNPGKPPPKMGSSPVLRKPCTVRAAFVILTLVLLASVVLQAILCKSSGFILWPAPSPGPVSFHNIQPSLSCSPSPTVRSRGRGHLACGQMWEGYHSSWHMLLKDPEAGNDVKAANAQIQMLTTSWEEVYNLNAQIPELKRDLDKASTLNVKVRGLQSSLENISKLLKKQNDILQMVSQGWKYFKENFYYFSHVSKTWYSAQQFCVSRNSHLTSVTSDSEQEFLYKTAGGRFFWIGLTKAGTDGDWYWVDDTPFNKVQSMKFWIPGEPNNVGNNEHCVNLKMSSLQSWNDASCDHQLLFICKRHYIPSEP